MRALIQQNLCHIFGEVTPEEKKEILSGKETNTASTQVQFLMSSLNIELVHTILTAVSGHTVGIPKSVMYTEY